MLTADSSGQCFFIFIDGILSNNKPVSSKKESRLRSEHKPAGSDSGSAFKVCQFTDVEVAHYWEKRPHGIYRFRFWVSRSMQKMFGQREVRQTLKTPDHDKAIVKTRPILEGVSYRVAELDWVGCVA